jgi:hypothetical protein
MLFPYTYVPHQMERMQEFIDFIFHEVWCKAPIGLTFHPDLFEGNPDLKHVMSQFGFSAKPPKDGKAFYERVKAIYGLFEPLTSQDIVQLKAWYRGNNDPERICEKDAEAQFARYADIAVKHPALSEGLATLFKNLYSQDLLEIAVVREQIGEIDKHYQAFVEVNKAGKCPFCGIADLLSGYHSKREAYDHYLPKALYPFNSINFKNLVPACHLCNSSYKTSKDPAHTPKDPAGETHQRAVFYPYALRSYAIRLRVSLLHSNIEQLKPEDITLQFGPDELTEKIDTWRDVYSIDERYKAKLCGENDGKYWLTQVRDECKGYGKEPIEILRMREQQAMTRPYADCNFLRVAFLEACENRGLI